MNLDMKSACLAEGLPTPEPEYSFHDKRGWLFDWAWPELGVAAESEGMARKGGKSRHTTYRGYSEDCEKYNEAAIAGWRVIRFTHAQWKSGLALQWIKRAIIAAGEAREVFDDAS